MLVKSKTCLKACTFGLNFLSDLTKRREVEAILAPSLGLASAITINIYINFVPLQTVLCFICTREREEVKTETFQDDNCMEIVRRS